MKNRRWLVVVGVVLALVVVALVLRVPEKALCVQRMAATGTTTVPQALDYCTAYGTR